MWRRRRGLLHDAAGYDTNERTNFRAECYADACTATTEYEQRRRAIGGSASVLSNGTGLHRIVHGKRHLQPVYRSNRSRCDRIEY